METSSLKNFLKNIGQTVYNLNTVCVGLHYVEQKKEINAERDIGLRVSYHTSKTKEASRRARQQMVKSAIVYCFESIYSYFEDINEIGLLNEGQKAIFNSTDNKIKKADKIAGVIAEVPDIEKYWIICLKILSYWRNKIIHVNSKRELTKREKDYLHSEKENIANLHANIDIIETYSHYEKNAPTLKDASTLISISIKTLRFIDDFFSKNINQNTIIANVKVIGEDKAFIGLWNKYYNELDNTRMLKSLRMFLVSNSINFNEDTLGELVELSKQEIQEKLNKSKQNQEILDAIVYKPAISAIIRNDGIDYSIKNFLTKDDNKNMSVAVSKLNGSHPSTISLYSDRAYYFIEANALFEFDDKTVKVEADSVLFIPKKTKYTISGTFNAVLINTPAFGIEK